LKLPEYRIDPASNRDYLVDEAAGEAYLEHIVDRTDLASRGERVSLLRMLGRLEEAEEEAVAAVNLAQQEGSERQQIAALIRLAHVVQWTRDWTRADELFAEAMTRAVVLADPIMLAFAHQHAGRNHVDQGRFADAISSFEAALALRESAGAPEDQLASTRAALQAVQRRIAN
jgi:tetratricopeptide (TPR) repeat protein